MGNQLLKKSLDWYPLRVISGDVGNIFDVWLKTVEEIKGIGREFCGHEKKNL